MTPLQKLPKNVGDLGKFIVAKGYNKLPKVQKISQSGHTDCENEHILGYKFIIEERSVKAAAKNIFSKPQIIAFGEIDLRLSNSINKKIKAQNKHTSVIYNLFHSNILRFEQLSIL